MAQITFFKRLAQINVCSHAIVLNSLGNLSSGLYSVWHFLSTWFLRCSLSITLDINFHASLNGFGNGRSSLAIRRLSM